MRRPLCRAAALIAYVLAVLLFCEGAARLALSFDAFFWRVVGMDDASGRLRFVGRREGPGWYARVDVHHPMHGWALRPGLRDVTVFDNRTLNSNSEGLRGRVEYARPKPPGVTRILVLGDSFTFGEDVGDDETYAHYLGEMLPGVEVVNLGVHGYGLDQMLLYLQEVGARYEPDVVLLGFVADDALRTLQGFRAFAKPRFELVGNRLTLRGVPVPTPEDVLAGEWRRSKLLDLFTMLGGHVVRRTGGRRHAERLTAAILDEMRRTIETLGAKPVYAYLPVPQEIHKADSAKMVWERFLFQYHDARGIRWVSL